MTKKKNNNDENILYIYIYAKLVIFSYIELKCKWVDCGQQFENDEDLHKHIMETHIVLSKPKIPSTVSESAAPVQPASSESTTTREVSAGPLSSESTITITARIELASSEPTITAPAATSTPNDKTESELTTSTTSNSVTATAASSTAEKDIATESDKTENDGDKMDVDEGNEKMDIDSTSESNNIEHSEKENGKEQGQEEPPIVAGYQCQWLGCKRTGFQDKQSVVKHLKTHFASKITKKSKKRSQQNKFVIDKIPVDDSEVSGVPLTAALLLRNLAKDRCHHSFFMPYQSELTALAIQRPKLARYILTVLGELKVYLIFQIIIIIIIITIIILLMIMIMIMIYTYINTFIRTFTHTHTHSHIHTHIYIFINIFFLRRSFLQNKLAYNKILLFIIHKTLIAF